MGALLVLAHALLAVHPLHAQTVRVMTPTVVPVGAGVVPGGVGLTLGMGALGLGAPLSLTGSAELISPISPSLSPVASLSQGGIGLTAGNVQRSRADLAAVAEDAPAAQTPDAVIAQLAQTLQAAGRQGKASSAEAPREESAGTTAAATETLFDGSGKKAEEPKEWTFMVFLNGHNNLDPFGTLNLRQMERVGSNDRINLVVQWASLGKPTRRMLMQRSEKGDVVTSPIIESLKPVDMGDADKLYDFIQWAVARFPAKHYFVDIWDHGSGWRTRGGKITPLDVSHDDQTGHVITTEQLGQVMRKVAALIGRPIDVLGFDACLMAMAEVAAEVADSVRFLAASEELEPGEGWVYDKVLKQWLAMPADDGAAWMKALTDQFIAAYPRAVTFSGMDLSKFPAFAEASKTLAAELARLDAAGLEALRKAARATRRYGFSDYGDYLDLVLRVAAGPAGVVSVATVEAVKTAFRAMIVANGFSADRSGSNGASVWLPMDAGLWRTHGQRYLGLAWHRLTGWGDAIKKLAGVKTRRR